MPGAARRLQYLVMAMAVAVGEAMVMAVAAVVVAAGYKWEPVDRQPTTIVFQNGLIAAPDDPIGLHGDCVTVLWPQEVKFCWEDKACVDVSDISTPPTPT